MGLNYGWEKFYVVVRSAIASEQPVQKRLASCVSQLPLLRREDFPMMKHGKDFTN
jgi:hypothetical protein